MKIKFRGDEKAFSTDYSIEILDDDNKPLKVALNGIDDMPCLETKGSILILSDNSTVLFEVSLGYYNDLRIYSANNIEIIADQKADNYVNVKFNSSTETP